MKKEHRLILFEKFVESSGEGLGWTDLDGSIRYVNSTLCQMLGETKPENAYGKSVLEYYPEETQQHLHDEIFPFVLKQGTWTGDMDLHSVNGNVIPTTNSLFLLSDTNGTPLFIANVVTDLTDRKRAENEIKKHRDQLEELVAERTVHLRLINEELQKEIDIRKQAEEALQQSEKKFRNILENLKDVYFEAALDGTILFSSPSGAALSGYSMDELIGNSTKILFFNPADRKVLLKGLREKGKVRDYETLFQRKNGELYYVSFNADITYGEDDQPISITGTIRDVTEQKKLRDQLQRSTRMESLGLMAGGIAHDLNNILSGIVSYPELLLMQVPDDSSMRESLQTIKESGQMAADVVSDLLTITKGAVTTKQVMNLNNIIKEYLVSAEHKRLEQEHPDVAFDYKQDTELLNIRCSSSHMKKIIMNLVLNASEAIELQGKVSIRTANRYLEEPLKEHIVVQAGEYVLLTVTDTGSGISRGDMEMIFEPFFTKKIRGKSGTGLGLAIVWNTVRDHGGYINVSSNENGTSFDLYFPVTRDEVTTEEEHVSIKDYLGNGERILVIDDEQKQREIAGRMLTQIGYIAEAVSSGEQAIQYLKKYTVDLIVLDMIMPGMNGRVTYERIIKMHPNQKAVIASGFAETEDVKVAQKLGAGKFLKKPYSMEKLGLAVRDELKK